MSASLIENVRNEVTVTCTLSHHCPGQIPWAILNAQNKLTSQLVCPFCMCTPLCMHKTLHASSCMSFQRGLPIQLMYDPQHAWVFEQVRCFILRNCAVHTLYHSTSCRDSCLRSSTCFEYLQVGCCVCIESRSPCQAFPQPANQRAHHADTSSKLTHLTQNHVGCQGSAVSCPESRLPHLLHPPQVQPSAAQAG